MDTIIRSRHGYREKKISEPDRPSSHLFDAVPGKSKALGDLWKLVAAVILVVFAAVLMLRGEFIRAAHQIVSPPAQTTEP